MAITERERKIRLGSRTPSLFFILLVVFHILVPPGVHNVLRDDGLDVEEQDKEIHAQKTDTETGGKPQDALVAQLVADGNGGQDEARVGEDHGPPAEVEVLGDGLDDGDDGDEEPPQAQGPQEDGADEGHGADGGQVHGHANVVLAGGGGDALGHADDGEGREGRRPHAHEQAGPVLPIRQPGLHQPADHVGVHKDGDGEPQSLARQPGHDNGHGRRRRLRLGNDRGNRARQHDGEDGQDPRRHHGLQAEAVRRKHVAVLAHGQDQRRHHVRPEGALHRPHQADVVFGNRVPVRAGDERRRCQEEGRHEEALARVLDRLGHVARVDEEPGHHERRERHVDDDVDDVDHHADGLEAGELMRLRKDEERQAARAHGQREPRPGEVVQSLLEPELGSVGVEDVDAARVVVVVVAVAALGLVLGLERRRRRHAPWVSLFVQRRRVASIDVGSQRRQVAECLERIMSGQPALLVGPGF